MSSSCCACFSDHKVSTMAFHQCFNDKSCHDGLASNILRPVAQYTLQIVIITVQLE